MDTGGSRSGYGYLESAAACRHVVFPRVSLLLSVGGLPGTLFSNHYFILVLPAVSLLAGAAISALTEILDGRLIVFRFVPLLLFAAALSVPILLDKKIFFEVSPNQVCGMIYPDSAFLEAVRIGIMCANTPTG